MAYSYSPGPRAGFARSSTGDTHTFMYNGFEFHFRRIPVTDHPEMLAQGRLQENAARKRRLNALPYFQTDYHAIVAFQKLIPGSGIEKNVERYRQRLATRIGEMMTAHIASGEMPPEEVENVVSGLRKQGYPV